MLLLAYLGPSGSLPLLVCHKGPLLYLLYTADVSSLLASQGLPHQLFADDVQAYIHSHASDAVATVRRMCLAMGALSSWMASNRLLLNPSKT